MKVSITLVLAAAGVAIAATSVAQSTAVFHNDRVEVFRVADGTHPAVGHGPGVVVSLDDTPASRAGAATWLDDVGAAKTVGGGSFVIVRLLNRRHASAAGRGQPAGSKPGDSPFTGMSFNTIFENERVTLIRARMEVGAREGFHTHASDTLVVHLSGGDIEDTAEGKTVVNHWKHGDVEFESLGSSHSARNVGGAVDVVLVALKQ